MGFFERMYRGLDVIFYNSFIFFLIRDMMLIFVRICCFDNFFLGILLVKVFVLFVFGLYRCFMKSDIYVLNIFFDLFFRFFISL